MKRIRVWGTCLAGLAVCVLVCSPAMACFRARRVVVRKAVVVEKAVVEAVVPVIATFAVLVPTYTASYAAPPVYQPPVPYTAPVQAVPCETRLKQVEQQLLLLKQQLDKLGKTPAKDEPPEKVNAEATGPPLALFKAKCAACHESKVSADNGNGFTLLQGDQLAKLTDRQLRLIGTKTSIGAMPKVKNKSGVKVEALTDEEAARIQVWLDGVK